MIYDAGIMMGINGDHPDFFFFNSDKTKILKFQYGIQFVDWLNLPSLTGVQDFEIVGDTVYVLCINHPTISIHTYTENDGWQLYASYVTTRDTIVGELRTTIHGSIIYYSGSIYWTEHGVDAIITDTGVKIIDELGTEFRIARGFISRYDNADHIPLSNIDWASLTPIGTQNGNPIYDIEDLYQDFISLGGVTYDYIRAIGSSNDGKGIFVYGNRSTGGLQGEYYDGVDYMNIYYDYSAGLYFARGSLVDGFLTSSRFSAIKPDSYDDRMEKKAGNVLIITTTKNLRYYVGNFMYYSDNLSWLPKNIKVIVPTT